MSTTVLVQSIEQWPIDRPILYAKNARTHSDEQVQQIEASIGEFGFVNPILVGQDKVIIAGHARLLAPKKLGVTHVPVIVLGHLAETQRRALVIADNKLAENSGWNEELLRRELAALRGDEFNLDLLGFSDKELEDLFADDPPGGLTDADACPEPPARPVSRTGDLWLGGPPRQHRVLCGDSTNADVVARVLSKCKSILMATDPPYGIELDSEWRDRAGLNGCGPAEPSYMKRRTEGHTETTISGDTRADWSDALALVPSLEVAYVWHASEFTREVLDGLLRIGSYPHRAGTRYSFLQRLERGHHNWKHKRHDVKERTARW